ncbi:MAG: ATP-binding cassette domain-containing protein [Proteobacteria bacterium]|nr:ATP-binding cassette domain-containing protein [Pseudomonadota bacterium]
MTVSLRLEHVAIHLARAELIAPLTLEIRPGQTVTVMGPSGSGKSTLLNFLCGTLPPAFTSAGRVWLGDRELTGLPAYRRRLGILFQDDLLFPHLSVGENLAFGLDSSVRGRAARAARIEAALAAAGLAGFAMRDPATLSGGQRARVSMLRTLLASPEALLLDEPFSKLDSALRSDFRRFVFEHAKEAALPVLLVTHDPADAEAAGGPIVELAVAANGEHQIREAAPP